MLAFLVPVIFAAITNHAWEDYYITLRSSRNLVEGHGLVFSPGERVHTFTSPLGVLLPALCTAVAGAGNEQVGLWLFRFVNAGLLAAAAVLVWRRFDALGVGAVGRIVFFGLLLADPKLADFATNGMETALLLFFALFLWAELEAPAGPSALRIGVACAGLLWTRPDAFILGGALILPRLIIAGQKAGPPRPWATLARGALLGGALYLPWFVWAWWYYGSPVPHTIIAKSAVTPALHLRDFLLLPWRTLLGESLLPDLFLPAYWFFGGWPSALPRMAHLLSVLAAFAWLVPALPAAARRASLGLFFGMFYLCMIVLFPWYTPPWTALAALALAFSFDHFATCAAPARPWLASATRIAAVVLAGGQLALLVAVTRQMHVQQRLIENEVRRDIGEWLSRTAGPRDTVFLEPLGYIGYFSQLKMYDYPGLSSPEVAAAVRSGARRFTEVIARLHPTWLVLRPFEIADPTKSENAALRDYELVRTWNVTPRLDAIDLLPGRAWLERDAEFRVFRRRESASAPAAAVR